MKSRIFSFSVLLGMVIFAATGVYAVDYFPSDNGSAFVYENGTITIHSNLSDGFSRRVCDGCSWGSEIYYDLDTSGNVLLSAFSAWTENMICGDYNTYTPNLTYLDFPLDRGKRWSNTAVITGLYGEYLDTVTLTAVVLGPTTITVPAGEFDVIGVWLEYLYEDHRYEDSTQVLWLHPQLGPVNGLISWSGMVSQKELSWGTVKSMFR